MLGLTVGCARCHNHKYDRITQADYYRMQAFFTNIHWVEPTLPNNKSDLEPVRRKWDAMQAQMEAFKKQLTNAQTPDERKTISARMRDIEQQMPPYQLTTEAILDKGAKAEKAFLLKRGDLHSPGQEVEPGYVASLVGGQDTPAPGHAHPRWQIHGRRASLANWIASGENP